MEWRQRSPHGFRFATVCRFNERGQVIEKEQTGNPSAVRLLFSYLYDSSGRLERILLQSAAETERVVESVRYDPDGSRIHTAYPIPLDENLRRSSGVSVESALHISLDAVAIMTMFDASDRPLRKVFYDERDRAIRRVGFHYDKHGLLDAEGEWIAGRICEDFRNLYRYDNAGRRIGIDCRWGDLAGTRRTYSYNEHSDIWTERIEVMDGLREEENEPRDWTQRYAYQYDRFDNWTERRLEAVFDSGDVRLTTIDRRELTYY